MSMEVSCKCRLSRVVLEASDLTVDTSAKSEEVANPWQLLRLDQHTVNIYSVPFWNLRCHLSSYDLLALVPYWGV
jgi:hypothetical protein